MNSKTLFFFGAILTTACSQANEIDSTTQDKAMKCFSSLEDYPPNYNSETSENSDANNEISIRKSSLLRDCDTLSDDALKFVFQFHLSEMLGTKNLKFKDDKLVETVNTIGGMAYVGKVKTKNGFTEFSCVITKNYGMVTEIDLNGE